MKTISNKDFEKLVAQFDFDRYRENNRYGLVENEDWYDLEIVEEGITVWDAEYNEVTLTTTQMDVIYSEMDAAYMRARNEEHHVDNYDTLGINPQDFL